jgi:hypothetical protein
MTTVSARHSARSRRLLHGAVETAAAVVVAAATVSVGARVIGVTPPASDTPPYCAAAYQCLQPGVDRVISHRLDPLVPYGPAIWNSERPSVPIADSTPATPSDPMLAPTDASKPPEPDFSRHRL